MDNAQKAIMIGVGLFITIIVIAAVMLITGMGQDLLNSGTQQLGNISSQLQSQLTQEFDGKTMTGAQVLATVKKYYNDTEISILVESNKSVESSSGGWYSAVGAHYLDISKISESGSLLSNGHIKLVGFETGDVKVPLSYFSDKTKTGDYINPTARYDSYLIESNEAIIGVYFEIK